ncbi:Eukaryotic_peptide chain release factor subunit 1 [Hexamita inflata]|uniref:Eukaryotic peptide chain release factor subunit 1 n=1 Tax=Hexamita inflata TaxID=28002 RepID=A0AA86Q6Q7_9EUKA|nr:Eukaryotic peptide chain release factor subunit 1 [Hexamita inflata]CAI9938418.1 Eukaryotic peptide chain release factor subunit 1 [Hexamita inflata]CAI9947045.1 Eukaryotic peptide chain release factor subunit 1 [Hexamita inflata]
MSSAQSAEDLQIELWRLKKQIQRLEATETNGTSVVSLIAPPTEEISTLYQMLNQEATQAACIKSRVNRQAVQTAITMAANRVMQYGPRMPKNGVCVFTGEVYDNDKIQKVAIHFSPCKPITNFMYSCDSKFHTEQIKDLLTMDETYGILVMDGHGCMMATLCGNFRKILFRMLVDLPKKHGRGGQSSVRFARLREEARHNYVHITAEHCCRLFIDPITNLPNVSGLIFAGSADFKDVLSQSDWLDARLKKIIIKHVDISYGMEQGVQQAIELSADVLKDVKLMKEVNIIKEFLDNIARDTRKFAFGLVDSARCLEMGSMQTVIVWEDFPYNRVCKKQGDKEYVFYRNTVTGQKMFVDTDIEEKENDVDVTDENFVEYLVENKKKFNVEIVLVTDNSAEGIQFCQGFGGLGGLLRWPVDMNEIAGFMETKAVDSDLEDFM